MCGVRDQSDLSQDRLLSDQSDLSDLSHLGDALGDHVVALVGLWCLRGLRLRLRRSWSSSWDQALDLQDDIVSVQAGFVLRRSRWAWFGPV